MSMGSSRRCCSSDEKARRLSTSGIFGVLASNAQLCSGSAAGEWNGWAQMRAQNARLWLELQRSTLQAWRAGLGCTLLRLPQMFCCLECRTGATETVSASVWRGGGAGADRGKASGQDLCHLPHLPAVLHKLWLKGYGGSASNTNRIPSCRRGRGAALGVKSL